jgi:hypothetical protein
LKANHRGERLAANFSPPGEPIGRDVIGGAIEGVPRDALNLAATVARIAFGKKISVEDVRRAAREWYQQDKMSATKSNPALIQVLGFIVSEVIETRRTRAFLFSSGLS